MSYQHSIVKDNILYIISSIGDSKIATGMMFDKDVSSYGLYRSCQLVLPIDSSMLQFETRTSPTNECQMILFNKTGKIEIEGMNEHYPGIEDMFKGNITSEVIPTTLIHHSTLEATTTEDKRFFFIGGKVAAHVQEKDEDIDPKELINKTNFIEEYQQIASMTEAMYEQLEI
jgi:hypothetical protein